MDAHAAAREADGSGSPDAQFGGEAFESVLRAATTGAGWAWRLIVDRYSGPLLGYLRVRASRDPEDALSETWMSVATAIGSFSGDEPAFRSWLFVIAHRKAVDAARRVSRRPHVVASLTEVEVEPEASAEDQAFCAMSTERASALLARLTPDQQSVIALRVVTGASLAETARIVGKRVGAVKALQRRGLATLRRLLEEAVSLDDDSAIT